MPLRQRIGRWKLTAWIKEVEMHGEAPRHAEAHPVPDGRGVLGLGRPVDGCFGRHRFQAAVLEVVDELQK